VAWQDVQGGVFIRNAQENGWKEAREDIGHRGGYHEKEQLGVGKGQQDKKREKIVDVHAGH
jgi:hypothetical protein